MLAAADVSRKRTLTRMRAFTRMLLVITHCPKQKPAGERLTSQPMARAITYFAVDRRRSSIWCLRNAPDGQNKCRERARFYLQHTREQTTPRRCMGRVQAGITTTRCRQQRAVDEGQEARDHRARRAGAPDEGGRARLPARPQPPTHPPTSHPS